METIYIQIMTAGQARWDDVPATQHEVEHAPSTCQAISDATGCPVRMTRPFGGISIKEVGRLNGAYFRPNNAAFKSNHFYLSTKAIETISQIHKTFPEMDDPDAPISGSNAVDGLCQIWANVKYVVDSSKNL